MEIIHYRLFHKIDIEKVPRKEKGLKTTSELCFKQMTPFWVGAEMLTGMVFNLEEYSKDHSQGLEAQDTGGFFFF